jgi:flagellar motor switch protein FliN
MTTETSSNDSKSQNTDYIQSLTSSEVNLDTLLKVPVSLSIEVGRTKMNISDLLTTREGSVIELDRLMDEPLDILVNGSLIAHGVVVLANDRFGIQITDIVSPYERVKIL